LCSKVCYLATSASYLATSDRDVTHAQLTVCCATCSSSTDLFFASEWTISKLMCCG